MKVHFFARIVLIKDVSRKIYNEVVQSLRKSTIYGDNKRLILWSDKKWMKAIKDF